MPWRMETLPKPTQRLYCAGGMHIPPSSHPPLQLRQKKWPRSYATQLWRLLLLLSMSVETTMQYVLNNLNYNKSSWIFAHFQGGHVRGSHNWFAQTFYDDLVAFYEKFKGTPKVIFYCQSSNGRGPRCAGWCVYLCYSVTKAVTVYSGIKITLTRMTIKSLPPSSSTEGSRIGFPRSKDRIL